MLASPYADSVPPVNSKAVADERMSQKKKKGDSDYEKQVSMARKERRGVDSKVQMLLNRVSYLKAEEAKLDRDFIRTQRRTEEMLLMKAERASDDDIYEAARDVLENLHRGLSGKKAAGRPPPRRQASTDDDTSDSGYPMPRSHNATPPQAHSHHPSARASRRSSSSSSSSSNSSGCRANLSSSPSMPSQERRSSLSYPAMNAPPRTSRSLSRSALDSGPQKRGLSPVQQQQQQHHHHQPRQQEQDTGSDRSTSLQQQQQQQQQLLLLQQSSKKPLVPARKPPSAFRKATTSHPTLHSSVSNEQEGLSDRQLLAVQSASEAPAVTVAAAAIGQAIQQGHADTHTTQAGECVDGPCGEDLTHQNSNNSSNNNNDDPMHHNSDSSSRSSRSNGQVQRTHECCQDRSLRRGSRGNSNDGSGNCRNANGSKGCSSGKLGQLQPAVAPAADNGVDVNGSMTQQSALMPAEAGCCPEEIDYASTQAQTHGATNHMQLLSQGVAAEVPDEVQLGEGKGSGVAGGTIPPTKTQLAGLHQFSTQEVPRVVHALASAPKESPVQGTLGHLVTAQGHVVMGVGWGLGAVRLGAPGYTGDQQQQKRVGLSGSPSKALRPTSSLGRGNGSAKVLSSGGRASDDVQQRQQIWALRRTFGLAPTVMHDSTAHLEECGAGAWK